MKNLLKELLPPLVINFYRNSLVSKRSFGNTNNNINTWSGNYPSWSEAKKKATGYDALEILEKCKDALLKVKNGEAAYERDSVLFDEIQYSWGVLAGLQRAALENDGKLCVLDFGGSLGSSYFQNKSFLSTLKTLEWCIVEQSHFVDCGKKNFKSHELMFYEDIGDCLAEHIPDVLLLSSVLQYLEEPYDWIERFIALDIPYIIIDRTAFVDAQEDILTVQHVPENIYKASYPAWFFGKKFVKSFAEKYRILAMFDNGFTNCTLLNGSMSVCWNGIIFKK